MGDTIVDYRGEFDVVVAQFFQQFGSSDRVFRLRTYVKAPHRAAGARMGGESLIPSPVSATQIGDGQIGPLVDNEASDNGILAASVADGFAIHNALLFSLRDVSPSLKHNKVANGLSDNTGS
jgi:hypothetical protein